MRLAGATTAGSGTNNEDGHGALGPDHDVTAAWVLDGVTGINGRPLARSGTDAQWFVGRVQFHLALLAAGTLPLDEMARQLVAALMADFAALAAGQDVPVDYDPPAACLVLVKRYDDGWYMLRMGDSIVLSQNGAGAVEAFAQSPNAVLDDYLSREATRLRRAGLRDNAAIFQQFRPDVRAGRAMRNQPGGYSILEADTAALGLMEIVALGWPERILLCSDGFYRAVDTYHLVDDAGLLAACAAEGGCRNMLAALRAVEDKDPHCLDFPRYKPADDATAVMLCR